MSHYTVGVIIKKENLTDLTDLRFCVEEALKPFDENLEVEPHEISESSKERLKEWYNHCMESREKKVSLLDFAKLECSPFLSGILLLHLPPISYQSHLLFELYVVHITPPVFII